eukprot:snap_masked-scaffold_15-processed-gene-9.3-mRNA-1 protein AED:1.00 eAED:1.00 QI:0/0/0/0/1/1/2/0/176
MLDILDQKNLNQVRGLFNYVDLFCCTFYEIHKIHNSKILLLESVVENALYIPSKVLNKNEKAKKVYFYRKNGYFGKALVPAEPKKIKKSLEKVRSNLENAVKQLEKKNQNRFTREDLSFKCLIENKRANLWRIFLSSIGSESSWNCSQNPLYINFEEDYLLLLSFHVAINLLYKHP